MTAENTWEQLYQNNETPWDQGAPSPGLVKFLDRQPLTGKVVVPGCGHAHDVVEIARRTERVQVLGFDIAATAVGVSRRRVAPVPNVEIERADLFDLPEQYFGAFDWVCEHTCFCAIDPARRFEYVQAVHKMLKPGGALLAIFYLNPREREDGAGGPPFGCSIEELDELFLAHFALQESWIPEASYPGREGRELMRWMRRID